MKIAIITATFQNYGSRIQNLATIGIYKKMYPGAQIDTLVPSKTNNKLRLILGKSKIFKLIFLKLKYHGKINKNNNLLNYKLFFVKNYSIEELKFLDSQYDLFVIGSDQIWNFPGDQKSNFLFGMFTNKKVCNAPSFAINQNTTIPRMTKLLQSFNELNVREEEVANYISTILKIKCKQLLDPTLRLPKEEWAKYVKKSNKKNYALLYILGNKKLSSNLSEQLSNSKTDFILVFNQNDGKSKFKYSPIDLISLVANSSYVITNSFHGACLASIFNKGLKIHKNNQSNDARFKIFEDYNRLI